jgi:hypothetical protein
MVRPGHLTPNQLVEVEPGIFLGVRAARAYRRAKAGFRRHGKVLTIVTKFAAYRDEDLQNKMADASRTPPGSKARKKYKLSSSSTVPVAYSPNGSHQDGRAFDFLLDGSDAYPSAEDRRIFKHYGWNFQFGPDDRNHVRHDNVHGVVPVTRAWCIKNHIWVKPAKK